MHRFSANYVFPVSGKPIRNGIVGVNNDGKVVEVINPQGDRAELASTEFHNGVIVPGFINAHCHTELSHFKGKTKPETGLAGFVEQVRRLRIENSDDSEVFIQRALNDMHRLGTVAVADICNTSDSFFAKQSSSICFANLIEVLGLDPEKADLIIERAQFLRDIPGLKPSDYSCITPHSTYTLSEELWNLLQKEVENNKLISIHFAESRQEEIFTQQKQGELAQTFTSWGLPIGSVPSLTPADIVAKYLHANSSILLVHNTFLNMEDAVTLGRRFSKLTFVLCPASNLFIEGKLPDVRMIRKLAGSIALGTDSLASSGTLSVFEQMQIISEYFPEIPFSEVLSWATINGAKALRFDDEIGSIDVGKSPGLNLISPFDFTNMKPFPNSRVKRLV